MKTEICDALVVGAGLSGLVCAEKLAREGLKVIILDENPLPGGQFLRRLKASLTPAELKAKPGPVRTGHLFLEKVEQGKIRVLPLSEVVGIFDRNQVLVHEKDRTFCISPQLILLATGAREKFLPFVGWDLPGVISTGALQCFMKSSGLLPNKELLFHGAGPLLWAGAGEALKHGAKVQAILHTHSLSRLLPKPGQLRAQGPKLLEGVGYMAAFCSHRVRHRFKTVVIEARGKGLLEEVITARLDSAGRVLMGTESRYQTQCLATGHGFAPNVELAQQAGCKLGFEPLLGGFIVQTTGGLQSSVENIFAAGEVTGIGGALKSLLEGELAALGMLKKLGRPFSDHDFTSLMAKRKAHLAFAEWLNRLTAYPDAWLYNLPDDSIICRCEDITAGDLKNAVDQGYDTPLALKRFLRLGMGPCQGRTCLPIAYDFLAGYRNRPLAQDELLSIRPPLKPVPLGHLLEEE